MARISSIVNVRGVILFLTKRKKKKEAHHTWLTKLRNNALACLRWLWLRRVVVSRPPPHCRHTEGLLHNVRPGCFTSVIKGIRLGRLDLFLAISHTAEHKAPGSEIHTQQTLMTTPESGQARIQHLSNIIIFQCLTQGKKNNNPQLSSFLSLSVELQTANITNFNAIIALITGWDIGLYYTCAATMKSK